jgi:hypothetical protein
MCCSIESLSIANIGAVEVAKQIDARGKRNDP